MESSVYGPYSHIRSKSRDIFGVISVASVSMRSPSHMQSQNINASQKYLLEPTLQKHTAEPLN